MNLNTLDVFQIIPVINTLLDHQATSSLTVRRLDYRLSLLDTTLRVLDIGFVLSEITAPDSLYIFPAQVLKSAISLRILSCEWYLETSVWVLFANAWVLFLAPFSGQN